MLNPKMEAALNKQVNEEIWSSYLYLSMSYDMDEKGFSGASSWFAKQAQEEFEHAQKIMSFITSCDKKVKLMPISEVRQEWNSPLDAFEDTLLHEKKVTSYIHSLMDMAVELKDYACINLLNFFVSEQVEEEEAARKYISALKVISKDTAAMYMFDQSLAQRS